MAREDVRFTQRDVREFSGLGSTQVQVHLKRLEELEYVLVHAGGRGSRLVYELLLEEGDEDGAGGRPRLPGLLEVDGPEYDGNLPGSGVDLPGGCRPQTGGVPEGSRSPPVSSKPLPKEPSRDSREENPEESSKKTVLRARVRPVVPAGANGEKPPGRASEGIPEGGE